MPSRTDLKELFLSHEIYMVSPKDHESSINFAGKKILKPTMKLFFHVFMATRNKYYFLVNSLEA